MAERVLSMHEVWGSIPQFSIYHFLDCCLLLSQIQITPHHLADYVAFQLPHTNSYTFYTNTRPHQYNTTQKTANTSIHKIMQLTEKYYPQTSYTTAHCLLSIILYTTNLLYWLKSYKTHPIHSHSIHSFLTPFHTQYIAIYDYSSTILIFITINHH